MYAGQRAETRVVTPDLARGAMLLLIAMANAAFWLPEHSGTGADGWLLLRSLLIDGRAYPLFALLLGFGLAVLVQRYTHSAAVAPASARDSAVLRLRLRGLWLLGFGAVHAVVFSGDILGAYGLTVILVAWLAVYGSNAAVLITAGLSAALSTSALSVLGVLSGDSSTVSVQPSPGAQSLVLWVLNTVLTPATSMVVPMVLLGIWLGRRGWLLEVSVHRRAFIMVCAAGLLLGAAGLPYALEVSGFSAAAGWWSFPLHTLSGAAVAVGLLCLLALLGEAVRGSSGLWRPVLLLGRSSLSGYLLQTVLFLAMTLLLSALGVSLEASVWASLLAGVLVWCVSVLCCMALEALGWGRQPERLLRAGVSLSYDRLSGGGQPKEDGQKKEGTSHND